jgi:hypothetical protein
MIGTPTVFLANKLCSILELLRTVKNLSQTPRNCPDTNFARSGGTQRPGAIVRRRAGGKDVVDNNYFFAVQFHTIASGKRTVHIDGALIAPEQRLRGRGFDAAQQFCVQRNARRPGQLRGEEFGLVKFALTVFQGMQWDGNDEVPVLAAQNGDGFAQQQTREEIFEPKRTGIFELMNGVEHDRFGHDSGAGISEKELHVAAVVTFKGSGQIALEGQAATLAEGRADKLYELAAFGPDEASLSRGRFILAKGADLGIKQAQRGADSRLDESLHSRRHHNEKVKSKKEKSFVVRLKLTVAVVINVIYPEVSGKYECQTSLWGAFCRLSRLCRVFVTFPRAYISVFSHNAIFPSRMAEGRSVRFDTFMAGVDLHFLEVRIERNLGRKDILGGFSCRFELGYYVGGCGLRIIFIGDYDFRVPYLNCLPRISGPSKILQ